MRRLRLPLLAAVLISANLAGCFPGRQMNLKPPEEPQVLASPGENDKRYAQPCSYPSYSFDNDPLKQKAKQDAVIPARGGPRPPAMGGMSGPGN